MNLFLFLVALSVAWAVSVANSWALSEAYDQWAAGLEDGYLSWAAQLLRVVIWDSPLIAGCVTFYGMLFVAGMIKSSVVRFRNEMRSRHSIANGLLPSWDRRYFDWFFKSNAPHVPIADQLIHNMDADQDAHWEDQNDNEDEPPKWRIIRDTPRLPFVGASVQACKAVFGTPEQNPANRLAVRKWLHAHMMFHGHRPSHIARDIELAISAVFVPSAAEVEANWVEASRAVQLRRFTAELSRGVANRTTTADL